MTTEARAPGEDVERFLAESELEEALREIDRADYCHVADWGQAPQDYGWVAESALELIAMARDLSRKLEEARRRSNEWWKVAEDRLGRVEVLEEALREIMDRPIPALVAAPGYIDAMRSIAHRALSPQPQEDQ